MSKVVITGANRGIGLALVKKYIQNGDRVIGLCRKASPELTASGAQVIENVDVTDLNRLMEVSSEIDDIDILINNAGILISDNLDTLKIEDLQKQLDVNTFGVLKVATTLGKNLKYGGIFGILTSRMGSIRDNTSGGFFGYRLSKAAANAIGKSLSIDFKDQRITVLMLHPGYVRTDMTQYHGDIDPKEAADGLFKVIKSKGLAETGTFWHSNGQQIPW